MNKNIRYRVFTALLFGAIVHLLSSAKVFAEVLPTVRINEVMASNEDTIADEDGEYVDWIELYNYGELPIDLSEWGLSDSYNNPFKWSFPRGTVIEPGEYLIVWASGKDRSFLASYPTLPQADLVLWLRADAGVETRIANGSSYVTQWDDLSGHGHHLKQTAQGAQPVLRQDSSLSFPSVSFDGISQWMSTDAFSTGDAVTVFVLGRASGGADFARVFTKKSASNGFELQRAGGGQDASLRVDTDGEGGQRNQVLRVGSVFDERWQSLSVAISEVGGVATIRNGDTAYTQALSWGNGIANAAAFTLGANATGTGLAQAEFAEVLVYNRQLSEVEIMQVNDYLRDRLEAASGIPQSISADLPLELFLTGREAAFASGMGLDTWVLHTNFSLSVSGEEVILTMPDGMRVDELVPTALRRGVSIGRVEGQGDMWFFFDEPTPLQPNDTSAFFGILDSPSISHASGFYEEGLEIALSHREANLTITYTLDGSVPEIFSPAEPSPFRQSHVYSGPIAVDDFLGRDNLFSEIPTNAITPSWFPVWQPPAGDVFKGVVVRARAFRDGYLPSDVTTATYLVGENFQDRYGELAVISLVSDYDNLFHPETGIYVPGQFPEQLRDQNFFQGWNRTAHITLFENDGRIGFEGDFGIRIQGSTSPASPLKGLHVIPRSWLGSSTLDYALFEGRPGRGAERHSFERFILRGWGTAFNWPVFFADAYHQRLVADTILDIQHYRPAVMFINGEYWGLHEIRDYNRSAEYLRTHHGLTEDVELDVVVEFIAREGDLEEWHRLNSFLRNTDLSVPGNYAEAEGMMDIENFIVYVVHSTYTGKRDWPGQNEALWRPRVDGGRWQWIQYDMDHGIGPWWSLPQHSMMQQVIFGLQDSSRIRGPHPFLVALLANPKFKQKFVTTYADWMNAYLSPAREMALFAELSEELAPFVAEHIARWPFDQDWDNGQRVAKDIIQERARLRPIQLRETLGLGRQFTVQLMADTDYGFLKVNSLILDNRGVGFEMDRERPWSGSYFEDYPVRLVALPHPEHRFVGWLVGSSAASEPFGADADYHSILPEIELHLQEDTWVKAVFEPIPLAERPVTLHKWNFADAGALDEPTLSIGGGNLSLAPSSNPDWQAIANTGGDFVSQHLRINFPLGSTLTLALPTTHYESIALSFLSRRSGQGAGLMTVAYTINGEDWEFVEGSPFIIQDAPPQRFVFDLGDIAGVANNPLFRIRIGFEQGEGGVAGNNRFDDIKLTGVGLPGVNLPPVLMADAPDRLEIVAGQPVSIGLGDWFVDPDGDSLGFVATIGDERVVLPAINGSTLQLTGMNAGQSDLTVTVTDGINPPVSHGVKLLVFGRAHMLVDAPYDFSAWDPMEPAGNYPANMLLVQSQLTDPGLNDDLLFAYHIPEQDASAPIDVSFPYNALARTRINGLGEDGLAFINTGRGRDLGAAVLTLDTRGATDIHVSWTGGTVLANERVYAIRLQMRTDLNTPWTDVLQRGQPVEYRRNVTGHSERIGPIQLPMVAENRESLQLRWKYYHISGGSGPRAQLRLDDVVVSSGAPASASRLVFDLSSLPSRLVQSGEGNPPIRILAVDTDGVVDLNYSGQVTLQLQGEGQLGGTLQVNAREGIATIDTWQVSGADGVFQLIAAVAGLGQFVSEPIWLSAWPVFLAPGNEGWNIAANWTSIDYPNGLGAKARVLGSQLSDREVELMGPVQISALSFDLGSSSYRNRLRGIGPGNSLTFHAVRTDFGRGLLQITGTGVGFVEFQIEAGIYLQQDLEIHVPHIGGHPIYGALRLREQLTGPGGLIKTGHGIASLTGAGKAFAGPLRIESGVVRMTEPASAIATDWVEVAPGGQLRLVSGGDGEIRSYRFGGPLRIAGSGRNPAYVAEGEQAGILGSLRYDPGSGDNHAIVQSGIELNAWRGSSAHIHVDGSRNRLEIAGPLFTRLWPMTTRIIKSGGGELHLSASGSPDLIIVDNGRLRVDGRYPKTAVQLGSGTQLRGSGSMGALKGTGEVMLNAGEILTVREADNSARSYRIMAGRSASDSGVLRMRMGPGQRATMNPLSRMVIYLSDSMPGGSYLAGFFSDTETDLAAWARAAQLEIRIEDPLMTNTFIDYDGPAPTLTSVPYLLMDEDGYEIAGKMLRISFPVAGTIGFTSWQQQFFSVEEQIDPAISGLQASPLNDSMANLMKYALGLTPWDSVREENYQFGVLEGTSGYNLYVRFQRNPDLTDIIYIVEASSMLGDWSEVLFDSSIDMEANNDGSAMIILDPVDIGPQRTERFLRLIVVSQ